MSALTELQVTLQNLQAKAAAEMAEKIATAKITAQINLLNNSAFQDALLAQKLREDTTEKLEELHSLCEAIVNDNKVYSRTLKQDRVWRPSKRYGMGNQFASLSGLLSGIQYSVSEHNSLMVAVTGLTPDLIESTLESIGSLPYYNVTHGTIVEGTKMNVDKLLANLSIIEHTLGVSIDKTMITQTVADRQQHVAMVKAEQAQAEADLGESLQQFVMK